MKIKIMIFVLLLGFSYAPRSYGEPENEAVKKRIIVVSSYHREYSWSRDTNEGFSDAMLKYGYFDNKDQIAQYTINDYVETSKAVIKKLWMDSKRKDSKSEREEASVEIYQVAREFKPDLIFLGDDNAADYVGRMYLDADVPVVFWGINNSPVKYGLVESKARPGHNVTGVYQSGYYTEGLKLLKSISPDLKTFAVLSVNNPTGRSHHKAIQHLDRKGSLPLQLVETVATNDYDEWKRRALELQKKVDAFFVANYSGLKDKKGNYVPIKETAEWFVTHINKPEATVGTLARQGLLCAAVDAGYNQGYEAVVMAHNILANGAAPATYPARTPKRGPLVVNKRRAEILGIELTNDMGIEEYID